MIFVFFFLYTWAFEIKYDFNLQIIINFSLKYLYFWNANQDKAAKKRNSEIFHFFTFPVRIL